VYVWIIVIILQIAQAKAGKMPDLSEFRLSAKTKWHSSATGV